MLTCLCDGKWPSEGSTVYTYRNSKINRLATLNHVMSCNVSESRSDLPIAMNFRAFVVAIKSDNRVGKCRCVVPLEGSFDKDSVSVGRN